MEMTYDGYIQNPMGVKNSVISNREMYRTLYITKWDAIKVRENGIINFNLYTDKKSSSYYCYMKIPSEVVPKFYYDVVVKFSPPKGQAAVLLSRTLNDYDVQFYSNDPSFVFTFTHAFVKNDLIIKDLKPRMSKMAVNTRADEKNPNDQVGYVKSLYFAYLEMKQRGLFNKIRYDGEGEVYDKDKLLAMIMPADDKVEARQNAGKKVKKQDIRKVAQTKIAVDNAINKITDPMKKMISKITPKEKIFGRSKITGKRKITGKH